MDREIGREGESKRREGRKVLDKGDVPGGPH